MNEQELRRLLESLQRGETPVDDALERLRHLPYEDLGFARVDHHRALRHGFPEVIFGRGKTVAEVTAIAERIIDRTANLLVTHATSEMYEALAARFDGLIHHPRARCVTRCTDATERGRGTILIITAGTADRRWPRRPWSPRRSWATAWNWWPTWAWRASTASLDVREQIVAATVVVAVAGMEGALPSAVGGLASCPVIAVPTSVGYGVSFGGVAALLGMLNSCASNVAVVNIDNGFGAGYVAALANRR